MPSGSVFKLSWLLACLAGTALAADPAPLADPTRPLLAPSGQATETGGDSGKPAELPRLTALFIGKNGQGRAVIDGVLLKTGDTWNGVTLLSIAPGRARILRDGEAIDLPLLGSAIKQDTRERR